MANTIDKLADQIKRELLRDMMTPGIARICREQLRANIREAIDVAKEAHRQDRLLVFFGAILAAAGYSREEAKAARAELFPEVIDAEIVT